MTQYDAMMRAVLENPGDDVVRLAFADWLDERGKPRDRARAEFIRLQCDPAQHPAVPPRVEKLLKTWGAGWLPKAGRQMARCGVGAALTTISVSDAVEERHHVFRRGFVDQVECVLDLLGYAVAPQFVGSVRAALAACPLSRFVLTVRDHAPEVVFEFQREPDGRWRTHATDDDGEVLGSVVYPARRELVAALPGFVESTLAGIDFERVRDAEDYRVPEDWGTDEPDEPDADDEILEYGPDYP